MADIPASTTKRLLRELKEYSKSPNDVLLSLAPVSDDDLLHWEAVLKGAPDSPYEDGLWLLHIAVPPTYPMHPPKITFKTPICHPNISFTSGDICLTLLTSEHWSPVYTISSTLSAIHQLLTDPSPDSPLNVDVAALLRDRDLLGWTRLVKYWTVTERWNGGSQQRR
ncbi:ubiquitin-conjugating enzyme E2 [Nannizzia gypsea CBS 118893]|uniref:Ubiquitin-conjugating enzyme E2 n=1 Tax=Arthroderma gypseum (strain ATCC MYA-4604 / CBS 118893) TaxID=535722 RepID=E4UXN1_ARTGP|nr:ubiquitin-conjugating enzyme E2 [Nannizzia gypsea CBS 118893]EFR01926.1 ubiquitin-conjugating enzyme E2 [Nannizzia gypsea CBS 118893]